MKLHLTDASMRDCVVDALIREAHRFTLLSFAYKRLESCYEETWLDNTHEIILDSGAFTAWSCGKDVDVEAYAEWAKSFTSRHSGKLSKIRYINLDVIPGSKGISATPEQLELAAKGSMQNADRLRRAGIDAIEVFHQDEPVELYYKIVERAEGRLIAISPRNDVSTKERCKWLNWLCSVTVKRYGLNIPPAHGLAVTAESLVLAFPFYSVDSSTWTQCLRFGVSKASGLPTLPKWKTEEHRNATAYALIQEVKKYQKIEKDATKLWTKRGIIFND
jgi:hypothetical protein